MTQVCNRLSQAVRKMWIHITVLYESDVLSHLKFISMFNLVLWKPQPKCWLAERRALRCGWLSCDRKDISNFSLIRISSKRVRWLRTVASAAANGSGGR